MLYLCRCISVWQWPVISKRHFPPNWCGRKWARHQSVGCGAYTVMCFWQEIEGTNINMWEPQQQCLLLWSNGTYFVHPFKVLEWKLPFPKVSLLAWIWRQTCISTLICWSITGPISGLFSVILALTCIAQPHTMFVSTVITWKSRHQISHCFLPQNTSLELD